MILTDTLHYFAYGSNMSLRRLRARVASAKTLAPAKLTRHRLAFHKAGRDGSAKCDIIPCASPGSRVHGVVFELQAAHRASLDRAEGLGRGYAVDNVTVTTAGGTDLLAFTYRATRIDPALQPFDWYLEHVLRGAREHGLPPDYIAMLEATRAMSDPDPGRRAVELAIYDDG